MNDQTTFSRNLRRTMTDAERHLWQRLRLRQLKGYKFRRQHPWQGYVLDFVCLETKLVIELDGSQHFDATSHDAARTSRLEADGFQVLRFWNNDVLNDIEAVTTVIWNSLPDELTPPSQPSPLQGEGESSAKPNRNIPSPFQGGRSGWGCSLSNNPALAPLLSITNPRHNSPCLNLSR